MADPKPPLPQEPNERQPEDSADGFRFNHIIEMQTKQKMSEISATLYALVETLVASGQLPLDEYERRRQTTMSRELDRARTDYGVVIGNTPDKYALTELPQIDCEARLPLCRARCCTLVFALSAQDLDERIVRWDYGRPYQIGRRTDGYCVHNESGTCHCTVYQNRPSVCRTYDCRGDKRIWLDFEQRIPAP